MRKILGLLMILMSVSLGGYSQPDDAQIETISGKKYYVHIVEQGNTLYGIHQLYNSPIETLIDANEGLSNDLTLGQRILIPIETSNESFYGKHIVKQGETLYGISKKYDCSVEDLLTLNQNLSEGISPGQELVVPKKEGSIEPSEVIQSDPIIRDIPTVVKKEYEVLLTDSIIEHTVLPHETLYSIAKRYMVKSDTIMALNGMRNTRIKQGDILKIPVKQVNYTVIEKDLTDLVPIDTTLKYTDETQFKVVYNIALMLPLMFDKNDREISKPLKIDQVREMYGVSKIAFDFYQGFVLAADSLTGAGVSVNIYVCDTRRDTAAVGACFRKPEFANMDLVIGPITPATTKYAAKLCKQKKIRIVLPFNSDANVVYENPYVYKGVASNMTLMDGAVDYVIENHSNHNIILVKPTGTGDLAIYERVKERFNQKIKELPSSYNISIVETSLGSSGGRDWNALIRKDTTNIFIIPSTSLTFVSGSLSRLNKVANMNPYSKNLNIIAFGLEDWNKFEDVDVKYRNRSKQHYASYRYLDFNSKRGIDFVRTYRNEYGTDPNVYSSQGFDYGMYFLSALHLYGTNFDLAISNHQMELTQNDFQFREVQPGSGRENQRVCVVKYDNYKLVRLK